MPKVWSKNVGCSQNLPRRLLRNILCAPAQKERLVEETEEAKSRHKNKAQMIIPYMKLIEVYDNVQRDKLGKLLGDCKICGAKSVQVFTHNCFKEVYKRFKEHVQADDN
jgi:AAA+ ATPase superfamily predicted ATPase